MSEPTRGRALVINNNSYSQSSDRHGSEVDVENIVTLLKKLQFKVSEDHNLSAEGMYNAVMTATQHKDHADYGMFILIIMSHGTEDDILLGSDDKGLRLRDIYDLLSPSNFPHMNGRPKVVIVQACSGARTDDGGKESRDSIQYDALPTSAAHFRIDLFIPNAHSNQRSPSRIRSLNVDDLVIFKSSFQSYASMRHRTMGSLFIRTLVTTLYKHAGHRDISELFDIVQGRVRVRSMQIPHGFGQVPVIIKTLTGLRKLYLFPGIGLHQEGSLSQSNYIDNTKNLIPKNLNPPGANIEETKSASASLPEVSVAQSDEEPPDDSYAAVQKDEIGVLDSVKAELNPLEDLVDGKHLGSGGFGSVYLYYDQQTNRMIAVKKVHLGMVDSKDIQKAAEALRKESLLMAKLSHERIVQYIRSEKQSDQLCIYMEYVPGGSVKDQLDKHGALNEPTIRKYAIQILEGLSYLHNLRIIHRDVKGSNVLCDGKGNIKLGDFGISKQMTRIQTLKSETTGNTPSLGTVNWMAPEVFKGPDYGTRADIWSTGATVVEMFTGRPPWHELERFQVMYQICVLKEVEDALHPTHSDNAKNFLKKAFTHEAKDRPRADELLQHPWFALQT